jgi:glutathione S-transferase
VILWGLPVSTYTAKVRMALQVKGLPFEEREPPGGYRSEAWRARVPTGTIPALEVEGTLLAESEAIVEYLQDVQPEPSLLPGSPLQRALARRLARFHDLHLEPAVRALFPLVRDAKRTASVVDRGVDGVAGRLAQLLAMTRPGPWLAGDRLSVADLGMLVSVRLAGRLARALDSPLDLPDALRPWLDAAAEHPAVQASLKPWEPAVEIWLNASLVPTERP